MLNPSPDLSKINFLEVERRQPLVEHVLKSTQQANSSRSNAWNPSSLERAMDGGKGDVEELFLMIKPPRTTLLSPNAPFMYRFLCLYFDCSLITAPCTHPCRLANFKSFLWSKFNVSLTSSAKCPCYFQAKLTALSFEVVLELGNIALSFLSAEVGWGFGPQSRTLHIHILCHVICSAVSSPPLISPCHCGQDLLSYF